MILTKNKKDSVDIDLFIGQKISGNKLNELLLIVPTNRKIRALKREIISATPNKAVTKLNLETIGTFSTVILLTEDKTKGRVLSEAAGATLMKQSFQETELKYFSSYRDEIPAGTLERIKNVISEYKKHGITPELLRKEADSLRSSEKIKALDIADIYDIYKKKCEALNVKEIGDIYSWVTALSRADFDARIKKLYHDVQLVIINGFDEFTAPEIEIIDKISSVKNIELYISFDYYAYNPLMFSHLDKCYDSLKGKGFCEIKDSSVAVFDKFNSTVREKLFRQNKPQVNEFEDRITVISALNREKEIENIAKEAKYLLTEKKIKPNKICVVFNLIQNYSSLVRDIFRMYGLPFNLTDRYSLKTSSPVISIINFLEILENDFYYKNIFRALSSGFLNYFGIDQSTLLKASVNLKIISGLDNWQNSLYDAIKRCDDKDDDTSSQMLGKELYEKALSDIKVLTKNLAPFGKQLSLSEFRDNLVSLIYTLNLPAKLINNNGTAIEENIKAINTFLAEVDEVFELLGMEFDKKKRFPLIFFLNNLRTIVASSRYNIKEKPGYGIQVTTLNEIRGLQFDYLFISELCDGDLPTRYTPEIFFSGSYARNEKNHHTEERYHFYQSLCSWKEHLYLTYPAQEDRKELVQSNFLSEFTGLFKTKVKSEKDYENIIYSKEDFLIHVGQLGIESSKDFYENELKDFDFGGVGNSLQINNKRFTEPFGESEYTGFIKKGLSEKGKEFIEEYKTKQYSISQLETYAKCPYKYFAERILKLKPLSEPTEDIEALEMGSLLHSILYKFYKEIRGKGIVLRAASTDQFKEAEDFLFKTAEELIEKAGFNSPLTFFEKEKITGINGERENSILYKFLAAEKNNEDGFLP